MSLENEDQETYGLLSGVTLNTSTAVSDAFLGDKATGMTREEGMSTKVSEGAPNIPSPEWVRWKGIAEDWARRFGMENFRPNPVWDSVCKIMDKIPDSHSALWISDYDERVEMGFYVLFCDVTGGLHTARAHWAHNPGGRGWTGESDRARKAREKLDSLWGTDGVSYPEETKTVVKDHWSKIRKVWSSIRPKLMDIEAKLQNEEHSLTTEAERAGQ